MRSNLRMSFFHDSKFKQTPDGNHYSSGTLTRKLFEKRYLKFASELTVVSRVEQASFADVEFLSSADHPHVTFRAVNFKAPLDLVFGGCRKAIADTVAASDYVVVRLPSLIGLSAVAEAKKHNKPFLIEMAGCAFDSLWNYGRLRHKLAAGVSYLLTRYAVLNANHVIYVTEKFLQKRYPTRGVSIACSNVSLNSVSGEIKKRRKARIMNSGSGNKLIMGSIGNVALKYKGHEYVIRSLIPLLERGNCIEYQLVGGGSQERLRHLVKELGVESHVRFLGVLEHDSIFNWLDSVDIYAQPSLTEGLPRALVEAMSRGCACIGTDAGGIPELLHAEDLVATKALNTFSERVIEYADSPNLRAEAGMRNIQTATAYLEETLGLRRSQFMESAINDAS